MNAFKRLAAAAAILTVAALVIIALNSTGGIAFADIVEKAAIPRAVTWNVTADIGEMDFTMRITLDGQGRMRQEIDQEGGVINIMDFQKKKGITIVNAHKMAMIMDLSSVPNIDQSLEELRSNDVMAQLGAMHDADAESLGRQKIDDVDCVGFRTTQEGVHYDVWADADTGLPVRIEMAFRFLRSRRAHPRRAHRGHDAAAEHGRHDHGL
ncbi:MAG: hypothetical protein CMJ49_06045 [Planctomycetaceae bacterium]|nr:hypothetical protein [Planctomycetaceae bacterium]